MSLYCADTESRISFFFFFNDTATTEIYTLSLHDALPICESGDIEAGRRARGPWPRLWQALETECWHVEGDRLCGRRSEEHTSELQSPCNLVCRLLLEKKKETQEACWTSAAAIGS